MALCGFVVRWSGGRQPSIKRPHLSVGFETRSFRRYIGLRRPRSVLWRSRKASLRHRGIAMLMIVMNSDWITAWLSEDRFAPYLRLCDGNPERALTLYDWNAKLSSALMRDISHFEIALRNTYDRVFNERWPYEGHWLTHPENPAIKPAHQNRHPGGGDRKLKNRNKVLSLKEKYKNHRHAEGRIIADLEFGFWTSLTAKQWEKELWTP